MSRNFNRNGKTFHGGGSSDKNGDEFPKPRYPSRHHKRNFRGASFWEDSDDESKSSPANKSWAERCEENGDDLHSPIVKRENPRRRENRSADKIEIEDQDVDDNFLARPNRKRGNLKDMFSLVDNCSTSDSGSESFKRRSLLKTFSDGISTTSSSMNSSDNELEGEKSTRKKFETDQTVLRRRQKQIDYGKNTKAYKAYLKAVPKDKRETEKHIFTPKKHIMYSRRSWDNQIKIWRKRLHQYDSESDEEAEVDLSEMIATLSPK